jgi:hypothetical protein
MSAVDYDAINARLASAGIIPTANATTTVAVTVEGVLTREGKSKATLALTGAQQERLAELDAERDAILGEAGKAYLKANTREFVIPGAGVAVTVNPQGASELWGKANDWYRKAGSATAKAEIDMLREEILGWLVEIGVSTQRDPDRTAKGQGMIALRRLDLS